MNETLQAPQDTGSVGSGRGRLKVYLGMAAGVGKTYRMLQEGHGERDDGRDVVIGLLETHGRAETAALAEGLPTVPRRQVEYRGTDLEEPEIARFHAEWRPGTLKVLAAKSAYGLLPC